MAKPNSANHIDLLRSLINFVGKAKVCSLLLVVTVGGILDALSIASIASSFGFLGGNESIQVPKVLQPFLEKFLINPSQILPSQLLILALILLTLGLVANLLVSYIIFQQTNYNKAFLGTRIFQKYINKPFSEFKNLNTDDVAKNLLLEVDRISTGVLFSFLNLVSSIIFLTIIILLLAFTDISLLLIVGGIILGLYLLLYMSLSSFISRFGLRVTETTAARFRATSNALKQIKLVKVDNLEMRLVEEFENLALKRAKYQTLLQSLKLLPRFLIEWFVFFVAIAIFLVFSGSLDLREIAPTGAIYALSLYKVLPAVQKIYTGLMTIKEAQWALKLVEQEIFHEIEQKNKTFEPSKNVANPHIKLVNCTLNGQNLESPILENVSLEFLPGSKSAIIGPSGSGKSSLLNLILGLEQPTCGMVKINNFKLHHTITRSCWNRNVGYVPQTIYLADKAVAENIAFLESADEVDFHSLKNAIRLSCLEEVLARREDNIAEIVGDNGSKFSGGQVQRIGIARALYKSPSVLVLDEATSALDKNTEERLLNNIIREMPHLTIIAVTHRHELLHLFDNIITLEGGKIKEVGCS